MPSQSHTRHLRLFRFVASLGGFVFFGTFMWPVTTRAQETAHKLLEVDAHGTHWFRTTPSSHSVPDLAPNLAVHMTKAAQSTREVYVVVFFHGWRGCTRVLLSDVPTRCREGEAIHRAFSLRDAAEEVELPIVFVVPQLSYWKRSGAPGRFRDSAYAHTWLSSIAHLKLLRKKRVRSTTLVAHSAGFETALAMLAGTPNAVDQVVMFDALYEGGRALARWIVGAEDRRALSLTLGRGKTWQQSKVTERLVRRKLGDEAVGRRTLDRWERGARFKRTQASARHREIPREQLGEVLRLLIRGQ